MASPVIRRGARPLARAAAASGWRRVVSEAGPLPRSLRDLDVDFRSMLGGGICGNVYPGRHRATGQEVAVKVVSPVLAPPQAHARHAAGSGSWEDISSGATEREAFDRVLQAGEAHPHVMEVVGCFDSTGEEAAGLGLELPAEAAAAEPLRFFVMERLSGQSLADRILDSKGLPEEEAKEVTRALCKGLAWLHEQGIAHRDVKPANVLFGRSAAAAAPGGHLDDEAPQTGAPPKLIDLSHAGVLPEAGASADPCFDQLLGTAGYVAPEVLAEKGPYGMQCDVYSLGCTVHAMVSGGKLPRRHPRVGLLTSLPADTSPEMQSFLAGLLDREPGDRPTVAEALEDPWLR